MKKWMKAAALGIVTVGLVASLGGCGSSDKFVGDWSDLDESMQNIEKLNRVPNMETPKYHTLHIEKNGKDYLVNGIEYTYPASALPLATREKGECWVRLSQHYFWGNSTFVRQGESNTIKPTVSTWGIESIDYIEKGDKLQIHHPRGYTVTMTRTKDKNEITKYTAKMQEKLTAIMAKYGVEMKYNDKVLEANK